MQWYRGDRYSCVTLLIACLAMLFPCVLPAQTSTENSSSQNSSATVWSLGNDLVDAADRGDEVNVTRQLKDGMSVDSHGDFGVTPLMRAAFRGHTAIAALLIKSGANVDAADIGGATPLHLAARNGHLEIVKLLLKAGATVDAPDAEQWTPLMRASMSGHADVAELLIQKNADVTRVNEQKESPLVQAASVGAPDLIRVIMTSNKFPDIANAQMQKALSIAKTKHRKEAEKILTAYQSGALSREELLAGKNTPASESAPQESASVNVADASEKSNAPQAAAQNSESKNAESPAKTSSPVALFGKPTPPVNAEKASAEPQKEKSVTALSTTLPKETVRSSALLPPPQARTEKDGIFRNNAAISSSSEPRVSKLESPAPPSKPFLLQLGTYPSAQLAQNNWDQKYESMKEVKGLKPDIIRALLGTEKNVVYRLRADGFLERQRAENTCRELRGKDIECFVVESAFSIAKASTPSAPIKLENARAQNTAQNNTQNKSGSISSGQTSSVVASQPSSPTLPSSSPSNTAPAPRTYPTLAERDPSTKPNTNAPLTLASISNTLEKPYESPEAAARVLANSKPIQTLPWIEESAAMAAAPASSPVPSSASSSAPMQMASAAPTMPAAPTENVQSKPLSLAPNPAATNEPLSPAPAPQRAATYTLPPITPAQNTAPAQPPIYPTSPMNYASNTAPQGRLSGGVSEAVRLPNSTPTGQPIPISAPALNMNPVAPEQAMPGTWLHLGDFPNEQAAADYWMRMFKFNEDLGYMHMALAEPISGNGVGMKVGPIMQAQAWSVCRTVNAGGYGCYVKGTTGTPQPQQTYAARENTNFEQARAPMSISPFANQMNPNSNPNASPVFAALPEGAFWVHLGNFKSEGEAEYYWMIMQQDHTTTFSGFQHLIDEPGASDPSMHARLKIGPFTNGMIAERTCEDIRRTKVPCVVVQ